MRIGFLLAPALAVAASTMACAQTAAVLPGPGAGDVIIEDNTLGAVPVNPTVHETLRPGSFVPDDVPIKFFGADAAPNLQGYAYFYSVDYKMVVLDPQTRRVVHILPANG